MRKISWQWAAVGIVALTAFGNATALAQTATLTLVPRSAARLTPGSSVLVDVFIDGVKSPNFLQSYQTQIEVTPAAGTTGTLTLAPVSTPIVVDTGRSDWVFSGLSAIASVREDLLRLGSLVLTAASSPEVSSPKYCGTYQFQASNDADGEFNIDFVLTIIINPGSGQEIIVDTTFLIDRSGTDMLIPFTPVGTTIRVGLQPSNDDCIDSAPIFEGITPFNNENTTTDGPSHPGTACDQNGSSTVSNDIWYDYTSTCDGDLTISTCGDADFDTRIAVYDGCSCPPSTLAACNDDASGCSAGTSEVVISATAGTCYKIRVGGFLGASGTGNITVSCVGNDTCDAADALSVPSSRTL